MAACLACSQGSDLATPTIVQPVTAGTQVTVEWKGTLGGEWPTDHVGPVLHYMAACDGDCAFASILAGSLIPQGTKMDAKTAKWFKIDEAGLYADKTWASAKLTAQKGQWTFKLPSTLKYAGCRCSTDRAGTAITSCAQN